MYNVGIVSHFCFSTQLQVSLQPLYMLHTSYRFNVFTCKGITCSDLDLILRSYSVFIKLSNLRFFSQTKKGNTIYSGQCIIYKQIMYKHQGITHTIYDNDRYKTRWPRFKFTPLHQESCFLTSNTLYNGTSIATFDHITPSVKMLQGHLRDTCKHCSTKTQWKETHRNPFILNLKSS